MVLPRKTLCRRTTELSGAQQGSNSTLEVRGPFPTTRWSVVLSADADTESRALEALEVLCRQYWFPLYVFARRTGRAHHEAEDCTQEFLLHLLASGGFSRARPERGRLRSFLLVSLKHFLANRWQRSRAAKRGGGRVHLSLDVTNADERYSSEPIDTALTPEQAFDRTWALELTRSVLSELKQEYELAGRAELFGELASLVWGSNPDEPLKAPAVRLGMDAQAFTLALHRFRRKVGDRLRSHIAETVAARTEIDGELRHLVEALASPDQPV